MHTCIQLKVWQILSSLSFFRGMQSFCPCSYLLTLSGCSNTNWMEIMCQWLPGGLRGCGTQLSLTVPRSWHSCPGKEERDNQHISFTRQQCLGLVLLQGHPTPRGAHWVVFHSSFFTLTLIDTFPLFPTGSSLSQATIPTSSWQSTEEKLFPRLLMGWEEALLSTFSLSMPWETCRLHSGSPSFCLQFEKQGQMFQRVTAGDKTA